MYLEFRWTNQAKSFFDHAANAGLRRMFFGFRQYPCAVSQLSYVIRHFLQLHLQFAVLYLRGIYFVCRMSIQNLNTFDPFADAIKGSDDDVQDGLVHIRIQQRNGRKTLTTVQGLSSEYDLRKIVRACKKEFACNGTVIEHPEYGEVLQLQGDQRENICQWLTKSGLAKPDQLKVHGF
ncbi:eukaryotic translation initiation factor eIF1 [Vespula maculifrons]